jgi:cellulose synthase/poly-beta-1,6-N-acetylglucosamine synthase-like glycosyltransferase
LKNDCNGTIAPDIGSPRFCARMTADTNARSSQADDYSNELPVELGFLVDYGVAPSLLTAATSIARAQAVSPADAFLSQSHIADTFYYECLADHLGIAFIDTDVGLGSGMRYPRAVHSGLVPLETRKGPKWLMAPRGRALRLLIRNARRSALLRASLAITTPSHLSRLIRDHSATKMADDASFDLASFAPGLSAFQGKSSDRRRFIFAVIVFVMVLLLSLPAVFSVPTYSCFGILFLSSVVFRLLSCAMSSDRTEVSSAPALADDELPIYSIIVPLHREALIVRKLISALDRIDYPRSKLEIKIVVEADDIETLQALEGLRLSPNYEIIVAPLGHPRTKPRALNIALPLLRGRYATVFDAEDVPEPDQLRCAAERFACAPRRLACLQARLAIDLESDNAQQRWLTRLFAIEYAALFDVANVGLAELGLPVPLGGTSNHFRISVLRELKGWDAWNVTEDADLGLRLARFGYFVEILPSTTHEEAPANILIWLGQRRRWLKGWMQTFITHCHDPRRLLREIGWKLSMVMVLMMTNLVIAPLLWPGCTIIVLWKLISAGLPDPANAIEQFEVTLWASVLCFGIGSSLWPALLGMQRRGLQHLWRFLPLLFIYNLMISAAAWLALYDLVRRPYHWLKTEHRPARSSQDPRNRRPWFRKTIIDVLGGAF